MSCTSLSPVVGVLTRANASRARRTLAAAALLIAVQAAAASAAVLPFDSCDIAVTVSPRFLLPWRGDDIRRFRAEAERVWVARGVDICWTEPGESCEGVRTRLFVRFAPRAPASPGGEASAHRLLGWIGFSERHGPGPYIVLAVERAREMLREAMHRASGLTPQPSIVERLLPQALGRALAHELGHFLLASPAHSRTGIMREALLPDDLAGAGLRHRLSLTREQVQLIDHRCEAGGTRLALAGSGTRERRLPVARELADHD